MRPMAGPAMLLVIVGGFAAYRYTQAPNAPSREFLDLELASADAELPGTCYSLSTVLIATDVYSNATRVWKPDGDDRWILHVDDLQSGPGGTAHVFQRYTFEKQQDRVHLVSVEASKDQSQEIGAHIDALLEAPNDIHSTPVDRCQDPAATGYRFQRRKT